MSKTIAYLGLGTMGRAMARNLVEAGYVVRGYDPNPEAKKNASGFGVEVFSSAAEAATEADVICSSVPKTEHVKEAYLSDKGALATASKGTVCFDFSTISPEGSCEVAEAAKRNDIIFIETPVGGSEPQAVSGDLHVMVGGDKSAYLMHKDVLEVLGKTVHYFGENGMALRMKLIANQIFAIFMCAISEGLILGKKSGLDPVEMIEYFKTSAHPRIFDLKGDALAKKDYTTTFKVDLMKKDLGLVAEMAAYTDMPTHFAALAWQVFKSTSALGFGDDDQSAIREYFEKSSGL